MGGARSINLSLDFDYEKNVVLLSSGGSVHIIGAYKKSCSPEHKTYS